MRFLIASLKFRDAKVLNATIIPERANSLARGCALKHPRSSRRTRVNRIFLFYRADNASSGVIAPRCVYIGGISMASKEFEIAGRSRYLIYRGLSGRTKTRSAPILICSPGGRCRLRHRRALVLSQFAGIARGADRHVAQSACPAFPIADFYISCPFFSVMYSAGH